MIKASNVSVTTMVLQTWHIEFQHPPETTLLSQYNFDLVCNYLLFLVLLYEKFLMKILLNFPLHCIKHGSRYLNQLLKLFEFIVTGHYKRNGQIYLLTTLVFNKKNFINLFGHQTLFLDNRWIYTCKYIYLSYNSKVYKQRKQLI